MNEIISGYLTDLLEMAKTGANFIIGELPAFASEIIKWGIASNVISFILCWFAFLACVLIMRESHKIVKTHDEMDYAEYPAWWVWVFSCAGVALSGLIAFIVTCVSAFEIFKAIFAPRLYLIEQIGKLISNN